MPPRDVDFAEHIAPLADDHVARTTLVLRAWSAPASWCGSDPKGRFSRLYASLRVGNQAPKITLGRSVASGETATCRTAPTFPNAARGRAAGARRARLADSLEAVAVRARVPFAVAAQAPAARNCADLSGRIRAREFPPAARYLAEPLRVTAETPRRHPNNDSTC